jgi:hypothetical protein
MEPPMFQEVAMISQSDLVPKLVVEKLAENLIVRDLVHQRLAGRTYNFNSNDDSWIRGYKNQDDINRILSKSWSEIECHEKSLTVICVIKSPDIFIVKPFRSFTEKLSNQVLVKRNPISVYRSLLKKKWYFNDWTNPFLNGPFKVNEQTEVKIPLVPFWFNDDPESFAELNPYEKSALHVLAMLESSYVSENMTVVYYENICNKKFYVDNLFHSLRLSKTVETEEAISAIKPTMMSEGSSDLSKLPSELQNRLAMHKHRYQEELINDPLI